MLFRSCGNTNLILGVILSIIVSIFLLIFLEPLLKIMGATSVLSYAMDYGVVIFSFSFAMLFPPIFGGVFRAGHPEPGLCGVGWLPYAPSSGLLQRMSML